MRSIDILGVGSLTPIKDYRSFISIVARLASRFPRLRCLIAGEGPERPALEQKIKEAGLEDVVCLAGHIPREQVLKTMRNSRIFLHTARYEGQGYVFLEARAAGMHVVCRDVGYTGNGGSVHRCSSGEEMAGVLEQLLALPAASEEIEVDGIDSTAGAFEKIYGLL
jgi:glycosyltransferase involved in cell wall biosynthesis